MAYTSRIFLIVSLLSAAFLSSCKKEEEDPIIKVDRVKYYTGHEYVDLGLSVLWAATNVGADSAYKVGDYYAWHEIETKESFSADNYNGVSSYHQADSVFDVARAKWKGIWHTPSGDQFRELIEMCEWEWTDSLGTNGYRVTGPSGASIFLPAAGLMEGEKTAAPGVCGNYWSLEVISLSNEVAGSFYMHADTINMRYDYRYRGLSVRPVARNLYKELGVEDTFDTKPSKTSPDAK